MAKNTGKHSSEEDVLFEDNKFISEHKEVQKKEINEQIESSMISYGEYIIENRAIPMALDGLKPSQRRSLYTFKMDNNIGKKVKLAKISGSCIGSLHPHGDASINDTIANMSQNWKVNYSPFITQGNWGSIAGDSVAAARYVEIMFNKEAEELFFENINKDNVISWKNNYDDSMKEPTVLPVKYPYHLINGTTGIAYSMGTTVAPFNIQELSKAFIYLIDNKFWTNNFNVEEHKTSLTKIIKAPDFPTGCSVYFADKHSAETMIFTPETKVYMRAKYEINENNNSISITNIPYNVSTEKIKEEILKLALDYTIEKKGRKETKIPKNSNDIIYLKEAPNVKLDKNTAEHTITLIFKSNVDLNVEMVKLLSNTSLEKPFSATMNVINENGLPVSMSLYQNIILFLKFRRHTVYQGFKYDLKKLKHQIHMINAVIEVLKKKETFIKIVTTSDNVVEGLRTEFTKLDEEQIFYVLDMKISRLTKSEIQKLEKDLAEKILKAEGINNIIKDSYALFEYIKKDYENLLKNNKIVKSLKRKSEVLKSVGKLTIEDTIKDEPIILMLMDDETIGYIEKSKFRAMNRGAKLKDSKVNKNGFAMKIKTIYDGMLKDECYFITNKGRIFKESLWKFNKKFSNIRNFFGSFENDEDIIKIIKKDTVNDSKNILLITNILVKRIPLGMFGSVTANSGKIAIKMDSSDTLKSVLIDDKNKEENLIILTTEGKIIKFDKTEVPEHKSGATKGRRSMNKTYHVLNAFLVNKEDEDKKEILIVSDIGKGKKVSISGLATKRIGQSPLVAFENNKRNGNILKGIEINTDSDDEIILVSESGDVSIIKVKSELRTVSRTAKGSFKIINNINLEKIVYVNKNEKQEEE